MLSLDPVQGLDSMPVKQYMLSPADLSRWHPHPAGSKRNQLFCMLTNWAKLRGSKGSNSSYLLVPKPGTALCGRASLSNIAAPHARVYDFFVSLQHSAALFHVGFRLVTGHDCVSMVQISEGFPSIFVIRWTKSRCCLLCQAYWMDSTVHQKWLRMDLATSPSWNQLVDEN